MRNLRPLAGQTLRPFLALCIGTAWRSAEFRSGGVVVSKGCSPGPRSLSSHGTMYFIGDGVPQNYVKAIKWWLMIPTSEAAPWGDAAEICQKGSG